MLRVLKPKVIKTYDAWRGREVWVSNPTSSSFGLVFRVLFYAWLEDVIGVVVGHEVEMVMMIMDEGVLD